MGYFGSFLSIVALRIPMILVLIVGLVFSLQRLEKHPRISFLAGIFFGGSLFLSILDALLKFLPVIAHQFFSISVKQIGTINMVSSLVFVLIDVALTFVLIFAIFGERADLDDGEE